MQDHTAAATPWWNGITRQQWTILTLASLGWVFDVFEGQLYAVLKTPVVRAVLGPGASDQQVNGIAGLTLTCFLAGGAVGGVLFGALGDRWGRRRVMMLTILIYSVFTALTAMAQTWEQLAVLRFLVALGVGGEWAVAAAIVAEAFPERARTAASGLFHASSGLGVFLAALAGRTIGASDWRAAFWLGLLPALLTLWVRRSLPESERWQRAAPDKAAGGLPELWLRTDLRRHALAAAGLATAGLAGLWCTAFWAPELVREILRSQGVIEEGTLRRMAGDAVLWMNCGSTAGLLCFAPAASRLGRRGAFLAYHVGALALVPATFLGANSYVSAVLLLAALGFAAVGMHAGYAIYFPELFPTRLRATGAGFCFNVGRVVAAPGPWLMGLLAAQLGGVRLAACAAGLVYLVGLLCLVFTPETRGRPLPD